MFITLFYNWSGVEGVEVYNEYADASDDAVDWIREQLDLFEIAHEPPDDILTEDPGTVEHPVGWVFRVSDQLGGDFIAEVWER